MEDLREREEALERLVKMKFFIVHALLKDIYHPIKIFEACTTLESTTLSTFSPSFNLHHSTYIQGL